MKNMRYYKDDSMKLVIEGYNKSIHKKDNQIVIKEDNKVLDDILVEKIEDITIIGKGYITFDAMHLLAINDVKLIKVNYYGQVEYVLNSPTDSNIILRRKQYTLSEDKALEISKQLIKSKILNQRYTLTTLNKKMKDPKITIIIEKLKENVKKVDSVTDKEQLMGIEGTSSNHYWEAIRLSTPEELNFTKRTKHESHDLLNAMLNYGYAIIASEITKNIILTGLDPYCGILHADLKSRTSLTYDLIEQFRQQLVDKVILSMIHKKQVNNDDYDELENSLSLEKRKMIIKNILDKLNSRLEYNEKETTYKKIIEEQTRKLKETLLNETLYSGFFLYW